MFQILSQYLLQFLLEYSRLIFCSLFFHSSIHFNFILDNQHSNFCTIKGTKESRKNRCRKTSHVKPCKKEARKKVIKHSEHGCVTKNSERVVGDSMTSKVEVGRAQHAATAIAAMATNES